MSRVGLAPRHRILRPLGAVVVAESQSDCHPTLGPGRPTNPGGHGAVPVIVLGVIDLQVEVAVAATRRLVRDDFAWAALQLAAGDVGFGPRRRCICCVVGVGGSAVDDGQLPPPAAYPKRARKSMKRMNPNAVSVASSAMLCLDQFGAKLLLTIALPD